MYELLNNMEISKQLGELKKRMDEIECALGRSTPTPQPRTPRLVEAVEAYLREWEVNSVQNPEKYHGRRDMRLALSAEKKRQELVEKVIAQARCFVNFGGVHCGLAGVKIAINNLDAYEKG